MVTQVAKEVNSMKTPNGGIKKTKQQRKEALFKKKRLRSVLSHKVVKLCNNLQMYLPLGAVDRHGTLSRGHGQQRRRLVHR